MPWHEVSLTSQVHLAQARPLAEANAYFYEGRTDCADEATISRLGYILFGIPGTSSLASQESARCRIDSCKTLTIKSMSLVFESNIRGKIWVDLT